MPEFPALYRRLAISGTFLAFAASAMLCVLLRLEFRTDLQISSIAWIIGWILAGLGGLLVAAGIIGGMPERPHRTMDWLATLAIISIPLALATLAAALLVLMFVSLSNIA